MHARIGRKFRVEAGAEDVALPDGNDVARRALDIGLGDASLGLVNSVGEGGDDSHLALLGGVGVEDLFDDGGADKDALERSVLEEGQVDRGDEALNLAAKVVAVDADVEAADELLAALFGGVCLFGEEDEAGAGAPDGLLLDSV